MADINERAERAAPFYQTYWDYVPTESASDPAVGPRNVVTEAIVDLLCFGIVNGVDGDVALETARQKFVSVKMEQTFQTDEDPEE